MLPAEHEPLVDGEKNLMLGRAPFRIDLLGGIDEVMFADVEAECWHILVGELSVPVISPEPLLKNKLASGRLKDLTAAVARMRKLRRENTRPSVADNERLCRRCSLRFVCLPEEERLATLSPEERTKAKLVPSRRDGRTLHITSVPATVILSNRSLPVEHNSKVLEVMNCDLAAASCQASDRNQCEAQYG